jgi:hypothetical protein
MRMRSLLAACAGATLIAGAATAQDADAPPPIFQVTELEHSPATMVAWRGALAQQAAAAKAAGASSEEMGWWTYISDNHTVMVRPASRDAMFPGNRFALRAAIREANPAADSAIRAAFMGTETRTVSTEIIQLDQNRSYTPAGDPIVPGGADVWDLTIAPGQNAAFNTAVEGMMGILRDLDFPYALNIYRVRYGQNRVQMVTFWDTRENRWGINSFDKLFAAHPDVAARANPAYQAFLETVTSMKTTTYNYSEEMSFPPGS